jgi:hypothetical protein
LGLTTADGGEHQKVNKFCTNEKSISGKKKIKYEHD